MATAVLPGASFADAFPCSSKVHVAGRHGVQVPMREITLGDSPDGSTNPPLRVYDTSGPQGHDVEQGLPPLRLPWIMERNVMATDRDQALGIAMPAGLTRKVLRGTGPVTQLHFARRGEITPEMEFVAVREGVDAELVRSEVARGSSP